MEAVPMLAELACAVAVIEWLPIITGEV